MRGTTVRRESNVSRQSERTALNRYHPEYKQVERNKSRFGFRGIWQRSLNFNSDPTIWQTIDRSGNIWWHARHPATGRAATRESEAEILAWLDSMHR